jgi:anti-sigma factor (TIGR02949 family)
MRCKECLECEERMQPYLDRVLDEREYEAAKQHLAGCDNCERRYRFEETLRVVIRESTATPMPHELKERLAALRIAL